MPDPHVTVYHVDRVGVAAVPAGGVSQPLCTWILTRPRRVSDGARIEWCDTITNPKLVEDDKLMKLNAVVEIDLLRKQPGAFKQQKKGPMQELLTGEIRLQPSKGVS